ncbi:hypothetical protein KAZ66_00935 [Candidatus Woesebacteria bacterium]|nr:hypothetical protein [Candidatus Woesebacteria bacterium]
MINKQQYLVSFNKELDIIKHLAEKITPAMLEYRPTAGQRSTMELLQYLGHISATATRAFIDPVKNDYMELAKAKDLVTFENFMATMDMQKEIVTAEVNALTEDDMIRVTELFGMKDQLSFHLLSVLKWITAYKMQLFLYIKANGVDNIGTSNVWGGFDMPPKA